MRQRAPWRARMVVVLTGLAVGGGLFVAGPARAASADETRLLTLANEVRASVGAPPLTFDESLAGVARTWAATMAAGGNISHNPALATQVTGWRKLAENVGMGPSIESIHQALVASHVHYVNLTDTQVSAVGIGVVVAGGTFYIVEDFIGRAASASTAPTTTAAPPTAPPTTAAPRPAPTVAGPVAPATTVPTPTATAVAAPPVDVPAAVSPALALALELTRDWERAGR